MIVYGKDLKNINRGDGTHLIFVFNDHVEEAGDKIGEMTMVFMEEKKEEKKEAKETKEKETEQNGNANIQEKGKTSKRFMGKIRSR
jgi:hypothetical protein|nr:MAG TPA_asm: hypothetical protein [Caudoviricetes sp.]